MGEESDKKSSNILVYGRVRPSKKADRNLYHIHGGELDFRQPSSQMDVVNNQKELYEFKFSGNFDQDCKQEEIFDVIAKPTCDSALDGYNGTIFAYGQTGSGKTFTITGGAERYEDRGLIPRTLDYLFNTIRDNPSRQTTMRISYLEIYNNDGYDLLDPSHESKSLSDLPKVTLHMGENGEVSMRNISDIQVGSLDEALNLLFTGDTNRMICETPSNDVSTRSHCIFTISLESREVGGSKIRSSKLHMVDLAGSERVKKTQVQGKILNEATYINLSLHFLEQVIVALHQKSKGQRSHVPYRNSMMTSVLRDSLGGNCKTVMIATFSPDGDKIDESISTARFAQRVSMIKNDAVVNEEQDPKIMIRMLKQQVAELKEELAALKGENNGGGGSSSNQPLTEDEKERCQQLVNNYVQNAEPITLTNPSKLAECFRLLKVRAESEDTEASGTSSPSKGTGKGGASRDEVNKLRMMVQARDNEISILVSMLKSNASSTDVEAVKSRLAEVREQSMHLASSGSASDSSSVSNGKHVPLSPSNLTLDDVSDRNKAFEEFRKSYRKNQLIEESKQNLKDKFVRAKELGGAVNAARNNINRLKAQITQRRVQRGVDGLDSSSADAAAEPDAEEKQMLAQMEEEKTNYKQHFKTLKELKTEIEHLQHNLEKSRRKLQADFENWFHQQQQQAALRARQSVKAGNAPVGSHSSSSRGLAGQQQPSHAGRSISASNSPQKIPRPPANSATHNSHNRSNASLEQNTMNVKHMMRGGDPNGKHGGNNRHFGHSSVSNSRSSSNRATPTHSRTTVSTGNSQADADIAAFYKMRDSLLKK